MKKRTKRIIVFALAAITSLIFFFYFQNNSIVTTEMSITSEKITQDFDGYRIVQLSDLHNTTFGKNQRTLVEKVNEAKADIIVVTGDLIDSYTYDEKPSLILLKQLVQLAPVYYVTGNHEWRTGTFSSLEGKLIDLGVKVLRNESETITLGQNNIHIVGIDDPSKPSSAVGYLTEEEFAQAAIKSSMTGIDDRNFTILLSHRPELITLYAQSEVDIVFTGHAHGGQIRLPFIGGLIAPNQGFLPAYTSGAYTLHDTTMIVSRGLGNSLFPFRIFNRPEIIVVTLQSENH